MILMKGSTRILEKPLEEQTGSTNQLKLLSIYGVTSYNDILNIPLEVRSSTASGQYISININSLGLKSLIYNGSTQLPASWYTLGSTYRIMYNGTNFVLLDRVSSSSSSEIKTYFISDGILNLTSSSSAADIVTAFGNQSYINKFIEGIELQDTIFYLIGDALYTSLYVSTETSGADEIDTIKILIPSTKQLRTIALTRASSTTTYTSVAVSNESLGGGGSSITVENDLTSDSQVNPPSVHAVNEALGQINTILANILS